MSCSYAQGLSKYENKGKLGLPERFDPADEVERKAQILAQWMKESKHTVIHSGAGISTAAGIPDFRGPNGVWTLEKEGLKPEVNISWDDARPTLTHMAIVSLEQHGYVQYVVTQNIDGLHLRSGLPRRKLAELHGDMFVDKCNLCQRQFVRSSAATTVGQKSEGKSCPARRSNGRRCRGKLHDNILDWEDGLPDADLDLAISNACVADLSLCLGTTLQIVPSGNIPVDTKKRGGKLVICNLQPTKQDRHADLIINTYVDDLMKRLLELMAVPLMAYSPKDDPLKITQQLLQNSRIIGRSEEDAFEPIEWTIPEEWVKDSDLAERVKARKVIRKRPGAKEEVVERKKVKNSRVSEVEERMEEGCCKNGEVVVKEEEEKVGVKEEEGIKEEETGSIKKEEEGIKEEETGSIKKEEEGVKTEKKEEMERAQNADDEIKQEVVKSETEEEKVKVIDTSENGKIKEEEEEAENGKAYSNGNTEDEKEENEELGPKTHNQEEREEEKKTEEDKTFANRNTNDGRMETDEIATNSENTKVNKKEAEDGKTKTSESHTKRNQHNDNDDEIKITENGRTEKCRNTNPDTGKGVSGQASGVTEDGSRSPGQGYDLDT